MGCSGSNPLDLDDIDPQVATLSRLKSELQKLQKEGEGDADGGKLKKLEELIAIKQELHDEPKATKSEFLFDPTTGISDMRHETNRLQRLHIRATEANTITKAESTALQTRLRLLERVAGGKEEMDKAAKAEYASNMTVTALRKHASELDQILAAALECNNDVKATVKLTRMETMKNMAGSHDNKVWRAWDRVVQQMYISEATAVAHVRAIAFKHYSRSGTDARLMQPSPRALLLARAARPVHAAHVRV